MRLGDFIFYEGVVEDRNDPTKLGRVRVRVFGLHTNNKSLLPTSDLPWSIVLQPTISAANSGVGYSPTGPLEGTVVFGYFRDGKDRQQFVVVGTVPGIPFEKPTGRWGFADPNGNYPRVAGESDVNTLARGEPNEIILDHNGSLIKQVPIAGNFGSWSEPAITYDAKYPFNHVFESESGHFREYDDTPGNERIHERHRSGTGSEVMHDGSVATRIVKDNYEAILGDEYIYVKGNVNITTAENVNIYAGKSINMDAQGDINIKAAGKVNIQGDAGITSYTDGTHEISGSTLNIIGLTLANIYGSVLNLIGGITINQAPPPTIAKPLGSVPSLAVQDAITEKSRAFLISIEGTNAPIDSSFTTETVYGKELFKIGETVSESVITKTNQSSPPASKVLVPTSCDNIDISAGIDYNMQLSQRFKLKDLTNDCIFKHWIPEDGWEGLSAEEIICNLKNLAVNILEPLADKYPGFRVNCAFRQETGNTQHKAGKAIDIQFPSRTAGHHFEVAGWIKDNLPFDQLVFEHGNSVWIHISYDKDGIRQDQTNRVLSYKSSGWGSPNTKYTSGLVLAYDDTIRASPGGNTFS